MVANFLAKTMQGAKKSSNEIYVHDNVRRRMGKASNPLIGGGREGDYSQNAWPDSATTSS